MYVKPQCLILSFPIITDPQISTMGKKRKGTGRPHGAREGKDETSSKLNLQSWEDVADSQDEFEMQQDTILLDEGPEAKRRRKQQEADQFLELSEEEVFAEESSSEESVGNSHDEESVDDAGLGALEMLAKRTKPTRSKKKTEGHEQEQDQDPDQPPEDTGGWGNAKEDYYNADDIETEQDALEEEQEALRIQKRQLANLSTADYGFEEEVAENSTDGESNSEESSDEDEQVVEENLPDVDISQMSPDDQLAVLHTRYPEFEPLRKDLLDLQPRCSALAIAANAAEKLVSSFPGGMVTLERPPLVVIKHRALSAYIGAIAMYLAILTSSTTGDALRGTITAMPAQVIHSHPVMQTLVKTREIWTVVKDLPTDDDPVLMQNSIDDDVVEMDLDIPNGIEKPLTVEEITETKIKKQAPAKRKTKAELAYEAAQAETIARRRARMEQTEKELAALSSITSSKLSKPAKRAAQLNGANEASDLGEETTLDAEAAAEKARRKRGLKFYASQITAKAAKRTNANRDYGGDMDVPHRERLRDRQERLNREAEKRGQKSAAPNEALGGESGDDSSENVAGTKNGHYDDAHASDSEDYYQTIVTANSAKKAAKASAAAAYAQAAKENAQVIEQEEIGPDGKRKITYIM
jgi:U3 small nucleolar RNA-associated protein 3